jgi:M6 family metalloprotease-like protein
LKNGKIKRWNQDMFRRIGIFLMIAMLLLSTSALFANEPASASDPTYGFELYDPVGPRPLLIVLLEFSDQKATHGPQVIRDEMFGPRPSMNDYWKETSYDNFYFIDHGVWKWVPAWNDPATPEDESAQKYWDGLPDYGAGKFRWWGIQSLYQSEKFDYSGFDTNNDSRIHLGSELSYMIVDSRTMKGGSDRSLFDDDEGRIDWDVTEEDLKIGDITFTGKGAVTHGGEIASTNPFLVYAHELAHNAFGLRDYYAKGVKPESIEMYSLMGDPYGPHHLDAYSKYKLGWIQPTIVTADGWYNIPNAEENPSAFILHDPAHGTDEYFLIENRFKGNSYDNIEQFHSTDAKDISDEGLVIWHVDETRSWNGSATGDISKVQLLTKDGSFGTNPAKYDRSAFNGADEGYYVFNDHSQPRNARWWSGQRSGIGIYKVSESMETMRAYFDVPGSFGIVSWLKRDDMHIDPSGTTIFELNVLNTGTTTETVKITVQNLDSRLTSSVTSSSHIMAGGEFRVFNIVITGIDPGCYTPLELFNFEIITESTLNRIFKQVHYVSLNTSYIDQRVSMHSGPIDVFPGYLERFNITYKNGGNVDGYIYFDFEAVRNYAAKAYPSEIQSSWVGSLADKSSKMSKCFGVPRKEHFYVAVPSDWAGLSDTIYHFKIITTSEFGHEVVLESSIRVKATPGSMIRYNAMQLQNTLAQWEEQYIRAKVQAAIQKTEFAQVQYQAGNLLLARNQLTAGQNEVLAYKNEIQALSGKTIDIKTASMRIHEAERIIEDMEDTKTAIFSDVIVAPPGGGPPSGGK